MIGVKEKFASAPKSTLPLIMIRLDYFVCYTHVIQVGEVRILTLSVNGHPLCLSVRPSARLVSQFRQNIFITPEGSSQ